MKQVVSYIGIVALVAGVAGQAEATVISGPDIIAAPASVADDAPGAENTAQQAFDEQQGVILLAPLTIDSGSIASGTVVDSHMIFLNTSGNTGVVDQAVLWIFGGLVIGVMSDEGADLEAASNAVLGAVGTSYPGAFANRGMEDNPLDNYTVAANTITVGMAVTEPGDWIRVITSTFDNRVTLCHIPPGNPDNAHTITVGADAVPVHLAHGDYLGDCDPSGGSGHVENPVGVTEKGLVDLSG